VEAALVADRYMSRGLMRGALNNKVVVVSGRSVGLSEADGPVGQIQQQLATAVSNFDGNTAVAISAETEIASSVASVKQTAESLRNEARIKGYEGEACGDCGNFTLVRNGTCLKCDTCGSTSGCS
ncbi:MAG TPA: hypothetical protein VKA94_12220, partial [Hyphomicrobiales bacterium]|nr:hypothetical protein [Hyphomicrobiales bacterium]